MSCYLIIESDKAKFLTAEEFANIQPDSQTSILKPFPMTAYVIDGKNSNLVASELLGYRFYPCGAFDHEQIYGTLILENDTVFKDEQISELLQYQVFPKPTLKERIYKKMKNLFLCE